MTPRRRALFGLVALGASLLAAGAAGALSWSRASCDAFQRSALGHDALVRARVARIWDHRAGEEGRNAQVEAEVDEAIIGRPPRGSRIAFTAQEMEINGVQFGFIPGEGDELILLIDRTDGRRWTVKTAMTADEYDRYWVPRCAL